MTIDGRRIWISETKCADLEAEKIKSRTCHYRMKLLEDMFPSEILVPTLLLLKSDLTRDEGFPFLTQVRNDVSVPRQAIGSRSVCKRGSESLATKKTDRSEVLRGIHKV
jgi:hypothetical protein